ncbi:MAG: hypothetical protein MI863_16455 [Desulfobacterales bacterium]|nr:hypothetical protein [Desulfobacterales bacterium]
MKNNADTPKASGTRKRMMMCLDWGCMSRSECHHSEPHEEGSECTFVCGADEPCSRCYPVEDCHG